MTKRPTDVVYKYSTFEANPLGELYSVTLSDGSVDRHGDTISPDGWKLDAYKANPVLLWAHDSHSLPIGQTLNARVESLKLRGEMSFAKHDFAKDVKDLVDAKILRAVSVGFAPKKYEEAKDRDDGDSWFPPLNFLEQELLELSVVPVPANPNALIDAKGKGLNLDLILHWAEKTLSTHRGEGLWIPRAKLEATVRAIVPAKTYSLPTEEPPAPPPAVEEPAPPPAPAAEPAPVEPPAPIPAPEMTPKEIAELVSRATEAAFNAVDLQLTGKLP